MNGLHARNRHPALTVLLLLPAMLALISSGSAFGCPLDRVVSIDKKSGQTLQINKVAVAEYYLCNDDTNRKSLPQPESGVICQGPYGDTIMEADFSGRRVYILYHVESSSPCCVFQSAADLAELSPTPPVWLKHKDVPDIAGETSWIVNFNANLPPWPRTRAPSPAAPSNI